jgi:hypothetical protein
VQGALYTRGFGWPLLKQALGKAKAGDGAGLLLLADRYNDRAGGSYSNELEAYFAIDCLDQPYPRGIAGYEALLPKIVAVSPRMWSSTAAGTNLSCAFWPVRAKGRPSRISASGAPPIVVVGTSNDPATPYTWAQSLANQLESGVLLTRVGEGHTAYRKGNSCIDDALDKYIVTLAPPPRDTVCGQDGTVVSTPTAAPTAVAPAPSRTAAIAPASTGSGRGGSAALLVAIIVAAAVGSTLVLVLVARWIRRRRTSGPSRSAKR